MADLVVTDLTVEFVAGDYVVRPLDKFGFRAGDGELVLLLGPSGCGKTTLLSCLGGILRPTSGSIRHGDVEVTELKGNGLNAYRQVGVGIVFQAFNLVPSLDALDNVALPLRSSGAKAAAARERARALLESVGMSDRLSHRPGDLSGGQQQRVAIARALALDPPLLLADEPTAHLDYVQVEGILRTIRNLAAPGRVVVVSTHDDRMLPLADRVVEMVPRFRDPGGPVDVMIEAGERLFAQGDASDRIYLVRSGSMEMVRAMADGGEEIVSRRGPGEWFGEMGPLFGLPRSATARASEASVLAGYSVQGFRAIVGNEGIHKVIGGSSVTRP
jgi:putative ABC transport system ATP-binding protein